MPKPYAYTLAAAAVSVGAAIWLYARKRGGGGDSSISYPYHPYGPINGTPTPTTGTPDYRELARRAAIANRVPPGLFARLITRESNWDPDVVGVTGDVGIAQLNPQFHPRGVAEDPEQALPYAARYLKQLFDRFGTWEQAVAAYNWGPTKLAREGMDNLPPSVRDYVDAVAWGR